MALEQDPANEKRESQRRIPVDKVRSSIGKVLNGPTWRKYNTEEKAEEFGEIGRTSEDLDINMDILQRAFETAELELLSDETWKALDNTDSREETWTRESVLQFLKGKGKKIDDVFKGIDEGHALPAPVVLFRKNKKPYLIGGNSRLLACRAAKIKPMVLALHL